MDAALPAEKYTGYALVPYETKDKQGNVTAYKWRAQFRYKDENGKWKKKSVTLKTEGRDKGRSKQVRRAAEAEAKQLRQQLNEKAEETPQSRETVAECFEKYIDHQAIRVEKSTANELRRILKTHIAPTIGKIELSALTKDDVEKWVKELSENYAPSTVKKCLTNLRASIKEAIEEKRIKEDSTLGVKGPKQPHRNPNALDARGRAKALRFIALDPDKPLNIGFALAIRMGLREGEVCGLMWKSVDLDARTLKVERSIGRDNSKWYVKEPKNGGSRRTLTIPDTVADMLRARLAAVKVERLSTGVPMQSLYVVGGADGSYMTPHYLSRRWRIAADALELIGTEGNRPTFHDLRHTFATAAITNGVDIKTVSAILGHSNAAMTLNIYASADAQAKKAGAIAVDAALQREMEQHAADGAILELPRTGTDN